MFLRLELARFIELKQPAASVRPCIGDAATGVIILVG
jgi:hypothetical protein